MFVDEQVVEHDLQNVAHAGIGRMITLVYFTKGVDDPYEPGFSARTKCQRRHEQRVTSKLFTATCACALER